MLMRCFLLAPDALVNHGHQVQGEMERMAMNALGLYSVARPDDETLLRYGAENA